MTPTVPAGPIHPSTLTQAQKLRAIGVMLGSAIGDALGAPFEFGGPGQWDAMFPAPVHGGKGEMIGGGGFGWAEGEFTDDTQMALALAESILASGGFDPDDLWTRFVAWKKDAADVGVTTATVLAQPSHIGAARAAHDLLGGSTASNGCIMRLGPVGIWGATAGSEATVELAAAQASLTHFDPAAAAGAAIMAELMRRLILGAPFEGAARAVVAELSGHPVLGAAVLRYVSLVDDSFDPATHDGPSNGTVWTALAQALWAVRTTSTFEQAVIAAINLGHDTDTVAAITGAIAGAVHGLQRIPVRWISHVHGSVRQPDGRMRTYHGQDLIDTARLLLGSDKSEMTPTEPARGPRLVHSAGVHAANLEGATASPVDHAVVSMCLTGDRFLGRTHRRAVFLRDEEGDMNEDIMFVVRDAVDAIDAFLGEGKQVVVHCHGGRSRTGLVLKAWYMKSEGASHDDADLWLGGVWDLYSPYNMTFWNFLENEWTEHLAGQGGAAQ